MKPECGQRQEGRSSNKGPVKNNLGVLETPKCLRDKFSLILPFLKQAWEFRRKFRE